MKKKVLLILALTSASVYSLNAMVVPPQVPDGGATLGLLMVGLVALVGLRHTHK